MRATRSSWLGLWSATLLTGGTMLVLAGSAVAGPEHRVHRAHRPAVICNGAIQHPLRVQAVALDPIRRGETVRVRVTTTSLGGVSRGEARLVSSGGTTLVSAPSVAFGPLASGVAGVAEFAVRLPASGQRFLLQFRVTAEGTSGTAARGATLNLLPDGPADPGRVVVSSSGERVVEYRARRIQP